MSVIYEGGGGAFSGHIYLVSFVCNVSSNETHLIKQTLKNYLKICFYLFVVSVQIYKVNLKYCMLTKRMRQRNTSKLTRHVIQ